MEKLKLLGLSESELKEKSDWFYKLPTEYIEMIGTPQVAVGPPNKNEVKDEDPVTSNKPEYGPVVPYYNP